MKNKILKTAFILIGAAWLIGNIALTPYSPCHDSLDLHNILDCMLRGNSLDVYSLTYMSFWLTNKLTVYCYFPFVKLFGNVITGVRAANGLFLVCGVIFLAVTVSKMTGKRNFPFMFFLISLFAPFVLLTGPYIYLPSIFIASAAMMCLSLKNKAGYAVFVVLSGLLLMLRPTCMGFILAFLSVNAVLNIKDKSRCLTSVILLGCVFVFAPICKSATGALMYKTGAHIYPKMQNSALLWTVELGTRPNGADTGSCTYTPYAIPGDADEIQQNFNRLWKYYYNDAENGTNSISGIKNTQKIIMTQIKDRTLGLGAKGLLKNMYHKTKKFYANDYLPYYYKANINDKPFKIYKGYEKKYFAYMNFIMLMFLVSVIVNLIYIIKDRKIKNKYAVAAAVAAIAVNVLMIAVTEVSKKYLFDFFAPMLLCICITCSYINCKENKLKIAAVVLPLALILSEGLWNIKPLKNADTKFTVNDGICSYEIEFQKPFAEEGYYIKQYDGSEIELYGKKQVELSFPYDSFNSFTLYMPDGSKKGFSSQIIK